jgi:hypothetical protein
MKFIFFVSFAFLGLVSCVSFNTGSLETQRFDHNKNFKIIGSISGSSKARYFLGIGGGQSKGSYITAKENMYRNYILKENQNITNIVTERTTTYFILPGLFSSTTVSISADVIEFFDSTHSNSIIKKSADNNVGSIKTYSYESLSENNNILNLYTYENINFVQIGDSVLVNSPYSNDEFKGRVIGKVSPVDIMVKITTKNNTVIEQKLPFKNCKKIIEN